MKMKKQFVSLLMAACMVVMPVSAARASAADEPALIIDGIGQEFEVSAVVEDGTVLVPLRQTANALGANIAWDEDAGEAVVTSAAHKLVFVAGSTTYTLDGESQELDVAAKLTEDGLLVPSKALAEGIGATSAYDAEANTETIEYFSQMSGTLKVNGSTTLQPIAQTAADILMERYSDLSITVAGGGSGTGVNDAAAGTVNVGMSSRELTEDELKTLVAYPVANDGIAIIVHPSNPVENLTAEQAAKIFLGEIKNWADVGGENAPIIVMTRETGSGTRASMEEILMEKQSVISTATPFTSSQLIKQAVAKDVNSIGFDSIGFVDETVKALSLDGVEATRETVIAVEYGMGRQLFCLTNGTASGLSAMFIDYLNSTECQETIVEQEGYVRMR
jgi:phosphate transport system substrate-binding protein